MEVDIATMAYGLLLGTGGRGRGYFSMDVVERMLTQHEQGAHNWHYRYQLWNLPIFELWHPMFIALQPTGTPVPSLAAMCPTI